MRIESLSYNNKQTQGNARRIWLQAHSPQHLQHCRALILAGLKQRSPATSRSSVVLGAGACTEVPLPELVRASDEVVLADLDLSAMQRARAELTAESQQRRVHLVSADLSSDLSARLQRIIKKQPWGTTRDARAIFDLAAHCLEQCAVPDPPVIQDLSSANFGLVVSSLTLSQLFSYPLLDLLDHIQSLFPDMMGEQERHRRYQEAAQDFRIRVINAHLHLLADLADAGASIVLLSDIRGFAFTVHGTDHDARHRRAIPLVPRQFPELLQAQFMIVEQAQWEWITDLPDKERPGRGYEASGYLMRLPEKLAVTTSA